MKLIGKGNTAEIFEYGDKKICKLFFEGYSDYAITREYDNAMVIEKLGLPIPSCYGIISHNNRTGIIYDRVDGKTILEHFFETGSTDFLVDTLVALHTQILKYHTQEVMSYKDFLLELIKYNDIKNAEVVAKILQLPDGNHLCHGDFHPQNIMIGKEREAFIIDCMNVCYGPWQYDVARTYFLISNGDVPIEFPNREEVLRMQMQLANLYLEKMNVSYKEIEKFISIISLCRKYE
ncbi:MAG: aminoglycoside phosphotransferase family protein [Romboutsia sp.]|uniref:aminoglycoside phosphotransferase family protein n=1 Tax=Romboutsia sp. TaxID=1965302 RepID=UPI003F34672A